MIIMRIICVCMVILCMPGFAIGATTPVAPSVANQVKDATNKLNEVMKGATDISSMMTEAFQTDTSSVSALIGSGTATGVAPGAAGADTAGFDGDLGLFDPGLISVTAPTEQAIDFTRGLGQTMRPPRLVVNPRDFPSVASDPLASRREEERFIKHLERRLQLTGRFTTRTIGTQRIVVGVVDNSRQVELVEAMARLVPGMDSVRLQLTVASADAPVPPPLASPPTSEGIRPPVTLPRSSALQSAPTLSPLARP